MMNFIYHMSTKILFGLGKLNGLATELLPGKKALIVCLVRVRIVTASL
jgi:alcohol dehydrogenase YqhD (iron-dependent ADH family)